MRDARIAFNIQENQIGGITKFVETAIWMHRSCFSSAEYSSTQQVLIAAIGIAGAPGSRRSTAGRRYPSNTPLTSPTFFARPKGLAQKVDFGGIPCQSSFSIYPGQRIQPTTHSTRRTRVTAHSRRARSRPRAHQTRFVGLVGVGCRITRECITTLE